MDASALGRAPSARTVARLMTVARDLLSKAETVTVAAIETKVLALVAARDAVTEFQTLIKRKGLSELSLSSLRSACRSIPTVNQRLTPPSTEGA